VTKEIVKTISALAHADLERAVGGRLRTTYQCSFDTTAC
jgi:hypothetical protein